MNSAPPLLARRARRRWWPTADEIATDVRRHLEADDSIGALRMLMDGVNHLPADATDAELTETLTEPATTGDARWDTLLAASLRFRLHIVGRAAPRWTYKPPLDRFWWPISINAAQEYNAMAHTPAELLRVGIFLDDKAFETA